MDGREREPNQVVEDQTAGGSAEFGDVRQLWGYLRGLIERGEIPDPANDPHGYLQFAQLRLRVADELENDPEYIQWCDERAEQSLQDPDVQARIQHDLDTLKKLIECDFSKGSRTVN